MKADTKATQRTLNAYVSGFILSIVLTLGAYLLVQAHLNSGKTVLSQPVLLITLLIFAVVQLAVQLFFFLHIGEEARPRWRLLTLMLAVTVVLIVVVGSVWIMSNLSYHMPASQRAINQYLNSQGDF